MKSLIAAFFIFLTMSSAAYACDTYDSATNQLTIPVVLVGTMAYTNVVITVGDIVAIDNGSASNSYDTYVAATNQLVIPCVEVGSQTYTNITITVGLLLGFGPAYPALPSGAPVLQPFNPLSPAMVGQAYSTNLVAGIFPSSTYTYTIDTLANGVLPSGMTIHIDGTLSGTPFATGKTDISGHQLPNTYTFGVCATDTFSRLSTNPCPQTSITVNPATFTLTTSAVGSGIVEASPSGPSYSPGTVVTLTATPNAGAQFSGWSGACSGSGPCTITMSANAAVTSTFIASSVGSCVNGANNYPACTLPQSNNDCKICSFDVYCSVFGAGGCWTCSNSTYSGEVCAGNNTSSSIASPGHCVTDPEVWTICN